MTAALSVEHLTLGLELDSGRFPVVADLSFTVERRQTLCIIGESGSGKTLTALALMRLLPGAVGIDSGRIVLDGQDLTDLSERQVADLRGLKIAMIFQEPMTSLNPVMTIGKQLAEGILRHRDVTRRDAMKRAVEMLGLVGLPDPEMQAKRYPHQLSGGMRQRAMIAMSLACDPLVLVADEPTTALDVSVQAEILRLIRDLQARMGTGVVMITHDFGVVAEVADHVLVMYGGRQVETAPVDAIFDEPLHPYTRGLLAAAPRVAREGEPPARLREIPGAVPRVDGFGEGCAFAPRCPLAQPRCSLQPPPLEEKRPGHKAACWEVA